MTTTDQGPHPQCAAGASMPGRSAPSAPRRGRAVARLGGQGAAVTGAVQARGRGDGWLRRGATALDTATGQVGEVQQVGPGYDLGSSAAKRERGTVWLRPVGGGREWTTKVGDLRPAGARAA